MTGSTATNDLDLVTSMQELGRRAADLATQLDRRATSSSPTPVTAPLIGASHALHRLRLVLADAESELIDLRD